MIAKPVSLKKAKKAAKQRAAAEANAERAEAFMAAKDGRAEAPKKRKAESDDEALAHDALEAAVRSGAAAAERKAAKKAKKAKKANFRDAEGDERRVNDTTNTSSERESKDQVKNDDRLEADDGSRAEKIAAFIAEHQIDVPEGAPAPFLTFAEAPFPKRLTQALLKQGYESPSPIQAQAWPIALSGKDIVAVAKTGSGKTCGFLLPALCRVVRDGA